MTKKLTKSQVDVIVKKINNLEVGESLDIDLPIFHRKITLSKGLTQSKLFYNATPMVTIEHESTPVSAIVKSEPYTGVFTYILPLITRMLYAKVPLISGRLEIP